MYTNADDLSNKIDELNTRINKTFSKIIAICETKLNDDIGNEAMPKNYTIIRKHRSRGRRGGVCTKDREDLNSKVWQIKIVLMQKKQSICGVKSACKMTWIWYS